MYSSEITNQFIELRSQNVSLENIAKQLGINKSTAIDWQRRFKPQIDEFKAISLEAIRERLTTRYEDELEYAMTELKRVRAELKTRDFDYEPTAFLHYAEAAAYRRVQKLSALADFPSPARDATLPSPSGRGIEGEGQTSSFLPPDVDSPLASASESQMSNVKSEITPVQPSPPQNPSETQPVPLQNDGGPEELATASINTPLQRCDRDQPDSSNCFNSLPVANLAGEPSRSALQSIPQPTINPQPISPHELEPDGFTGSIVYTPGECAQGIIQKCLEAEAAYRKTKSAANEN